MADGVKHEHWGSSFGFVMAAVGSAIGLGNVWRFPFITGENGGGAFVLIYLLCIALVGLPVMLAELAIGRASQGDPIKAFQHFAIRSPRLPKVASGFGLGLAAALAGSHNYGMSVLLVILSILIYHYGWSTVGFSCTLVAGLILSYYAIIGGWIFLYAWKSFAHELVFASLKEAGAYLDSVSSNGWLSSGLTLAFMLASAGICWFGVKKGIETVSKIMMPLLFVLVLVLVVRSVTLPGASKGVEFFLKPDFSKINGSSILDALGHAFYSLSLGMAILITYGSYLSKKRNILKSSLWIVFFDTLIALLAGLAIFPALFAQGGNPAQGPALVFNTLPITFESIPGGLGWLWNGLFFLLLAIAALTSGLSLQEAVVSSFMQNLKLSRRASVLLSTVLITGLGCVISFSVNDWSHLPSLHRLLTGLFGGVKSSLFDLIDYVASNWILLLNGLAAAFYAGWVWGTNGAARELYRTGADLKGLSKLQKFNRTRLPVISWSVFIRFISPVLIFVTFLSAAGFFQKAQKPAEAEPAAQESVQTPAQQPSEIIEVEAAPAVEPAPFHRLKGAAWRPEQWWNPADGAGFAFSASVRFAASPETAVPVLSVWDEFDLSSSPDYPVIFTADGATYAVSRPAGDDEAFFPANRWVKLGVSWDPAKKRLLVSRNGKLYAAKKLETAPEAAASETVFDIFCDRLYPHAIDAEQAARISKQGL
ncbi:MAG: sodium-dependent transporter [Lentisphaeria bacterium]|nr:sodium-dependent transporter [Lentisphaeria bacterium]